MPKHDKTSAAIFATPTRANLAWKDVEALFRHLGATVTEGEGSRVNVGLNGVDYTFHQPHPNKEIGKPTVRQAREFLIDARVVPEEE